MEELFNDDPSDWPKEFAELRTLDSLLRCSICFEYFDIAVMATGCYHNYCSLCARRHISYKTQCPSCPVEMLQSHLKCNRVLDEIVKTFKALRPKLIEILKEYKDMKAGSKSSIAEAPPESVLTRPIRTSRRAPDYSYRSTDDEDDNSEPNVKTKLKKSEKSFAGSTTATLTGSGKESETDDSETGKLNVDKVRCPVCKKIPKSEINRHLDYFCLKRKKRKVIARSSSERSPENAPSYKRSRTDKGLMAANNFAADSGKSDTSSDEDTKEPVSSRREESESFARLKQCEYSLREALQGSARSEVPSLSRAELNTSRMTSNRDAPSLKAASNALLTSDKDNELPKSSTSLKPGPSGISTNLHPSSHKRATKQLLSNDADNEPPKSSSLKPRSSGTSTNQHRISKNQVTKKLLSSDADNEPPTSPSPKPGPSCIKTNQSAFSQIPTSKTLNNSDKDNEPTKSRSPKPGPSGISTNQRQFSEKSVSKSLSYKDDDTAGCDNGDDSDGNTEHLAASNTEPSDSFIISSQRVSTQKVASNQLLPKNSTEKRKKLPELVLSGLTVPKLRMRLKALGLSTKGGKKALQNRLKNYNLLYNAQCDAVSPMPISEIIKEVEMMEANQKNLDQGSVLMKTFDHSKTDEEKKEFNENYLIMHKDHYAKLIKEAASRRGMKKNECREDRESLKAQPLRSELKGINPPKDFCVSENTGQEKKGFKQENSGAFKEKAKISHILQKSSESNASKEQIGNGSIKPEMPDTQQNEQMDSHSQTKGDKSKEQVNLEKLSKAVNETMSFVRKELKSKIGIISLAKRGRRRNFDSSRSSTESHRVAGTISETCAGAGKMAKTQLEGKLETVKKDRSENYSDRCSADPQSVAGNSSQRHKQKEKLAKSNEGERLETLNEDRNSNSSDDSATSLCNGNQISMENSEKEDPKPDINESSEEESARPKPEFPLSMSQSPEHEAVIDNVFDNLLGGKLTKQEDQEAAIFPQHESTPLRKTQPGNCTNESIVISDSDDDDDDNDAKTSKICPEGRESEIGKLLPQSGMKKLPLNNSKSKVSFLSKRSNYVDPSSDGKMDIKSNGSQQGSRSLFSSSQKGGSTKMVDINRSQSNKKSNRKNKGKEVKSMNIESSFKKANKKKESGHKRDEHVSNPSQHKRCEPPKQNAMKTRGDQKNEATYDSTSLFDESSSDEPSCPQSTQISVSRTSSSDEESQTIL